jgi:hypothetical protein
VRATALGALGAGIAATAAVLLVGSAGAHGTKAVAIKVTASRVTARAVPSTATTVDVSALPDAKSSAKTKLKSLPFMSPLGAAGLKAAKANAAANAPSAGALVSRLAGKAPAGTPAASVQGVDGMKDSPTICAPFGCQPPDHGVAASPKYLVQAVNTSLAVWQLGKKAKLKKVVDFSKFFKIPAPTPAGCDPDDNDLPFISDPRLQYDPATQRFYVAILQVEGAPGFGISPDCDFVSRYWVGVSKSDNPSGKWYLYAFDTSSLVDPLGAADYTQMGFDGEAIFIGGNEFDSVAGSYNGAWTLAIPKAAAEAGAAIPTITGFGGYTADDGTATRTLDTVQPVISLGDGAAGPAGEILISSFNESITESKVVLFDFSNALAAQGNPQTLSEVVLDGVLPYSQPPLADDPPACTDCLETIDNRISATPVYMHGMVYASHDSAVDNGTAVNANVHWMVIRPVLDQNAVGGCSLCSEITSDTSLVHDEYLTFPGETDTWFGVIQPDREGNIFLGFEGASTTFAVSPSGAYVSRRATSDVWGPNGAVCLPQCQTTPTTNVRWGDYEAATFDGWDSNNVWIATEYSDPASGGDWGTHLDLVKYTSADQQ